MSSVSSTGPHNGPSIRPQFAQFFLFLPKSTQSAQRPTKGQHSGPSIRPAAVCTVGLASCLSQHSGPSIHPATVCTGGLASCLSQHSGPSIHPATVCTGGLASCLSPAGPSQLSHNPHNGLSDLPHSAQWAQHPTTVRTVGQGHLHNELSIQPRSKQWAQHSVTVQNVLSIRLWST